MKMLVFASHEGKVTLQISDDSEKVLLSVGFEPDDADGIAGQIAKCSDMVRRSSVPSGQRTN